MKPTKYLPSISCSILLATLAQAALAQNADIPRLPSGKPDLNGLWEFPYVPDMAIKGNGRTLSGPGELPLTDAGKLNFERYDTSEGDYTGACLPFGHIRSMNSPNPVQFFQTDNAFAYLFEVNTWHHAFPIGGEDITMDLPPTWYGNSHAEWDGDTLVVTTRNYNGKTRLDTVGHPHSHRLTATEKFTMQDANTIAYEITIDDPLYYSEPWSNQRRFTRMTDGLGLLEYSCEENNLGVIEGRIKPPDYSNWHTYEVEE
ncbi:MAG: hypothetical protein LBE21_08435 [Pseudomonadales bacterium]|jgi:hypothetical protein|nr:hypothetical protein [Pseudomonadales bacterium]